MAAAYLILLVTIAFVELQPFMIAQMFDVAEAETAISFRDAGYSSAEACSVELLA